MEFWYDVYGLAPTKEMGSIEAFLTHFADRDKIENRKRDHLILIPDVPIREKHALFKSRFAHLDELFPQKQPSSGKSQPNPAEPEVVTIHSVTEGIRLGLSRSNTAFSLYIRHYTRKDIKCLLIHFTNDNKVVFGISVAEKNAHNEDNLPLAEKLAQEMKTVIPVRDTSILFEQPPPDSEQEFIDCKQIRQERGEISKRASSGGIRSLWDIEHKLFYSIYRQRLHRRFREVKGKVVYAPNLTDYFTLGDKSGRLINIITDHGDYLFRRKVQNPRATDATTLPFLGYLLDKVVLGPDTGFAPTHVVKISLPSRTQPEYIWIGHRDSASDFTTYEGFRTAKAHVRETYALDNLLDIKRLAEEGLFLFNETFLHESSIEAYEKWLVAYGQAQLYIDLLQDEELAWKPNAITLLKLYGQEDWPRFVSYLRQFEVDRSQLRDVLTELGTSDSWQTWQLAELFPLITLTQEEYGYLLGQVYRSNNFERYRWLFSRREKPASLSYLTQQIREGIAKRTDPQAHNFIRLYLEEIEKEYGTFCDYPSLLALAALEDHAELLGAFLRLLPQAEWRSKQLLNIALATENQSLVAQLPLTPAEIDQVRQQAEAFIEPTAEERTQRIKHAAKEGNYFQVRFLAPLVAPKDLITPMLDASKAGMIGIVRLLIEQGNAAADCWFNFPVKFANKGGFRRLKQYLLSKGVKDEAFE
jgi:hypothetical protein